MTVKRTSGSVSEVSAPPVDVPAPQRHGAIARDGVFLSLQRYARDGARPVLLLHGWAQSPAAWDGPVKGHSLAKYLYGAGVDVWMACWRGHGDWTSGSGRPADWRLDDLAALDLPALVSRVKALTGRRPTLIGHSMGALVALMYAAGASPHARGVCADPYLARRHQQDIESVVAVAAPLAFSQRAVPLFSARPDLAGRLICALGAHRVGKWILRAHPHIRFGALVRDAAGVPVVGPLLKRACVRAATSRLSRAFWNPDNVSRELAEAELTHTLDTTSAGELMQFAAWVRRGGLSEPGVDWARAFGHVTLPVMFVVGERDGLAGAEGALWEGLSRLGSEEMQLLLVTGAGHNDLRIGRRAVHAVYPSVAAWVQGEER